MKAALLALAFLSLAGCHVGSSKEPPTADHPAGSASTTDKGSEKSRDAMLGKSMKVEGEHWAGTPAAAASIAAPAKKDDSGAATPTPPTSATAPKAPVGGGH